MKILVINAGSSSLKFQLIDMENEAVIAKGICEEIGGKSGFKFKVPGREDYKAAVSMPICKATGHPNLFNCMKSVLFSRPSLKPSR